MNFAPVFDLFDLATVALKLVFYYWLLANFIWAMVVVSNSDLLESLNDWRQRCIAARGYWFWLLTLAKALAAQPFYYLWEIFTSLFSPRSWK